MEAKTNYTMVGLIVLLLTAGLLIAGLWLSTGFNHKSYSFYTVYLHEAVSGLAEGSAVKFNGVQVGFVKSIKLNKNDPRQVEILLSIEEGIPITTSTSATLISQGITGVAFVGLAAGSSDITPLKKMPGEPYPVIPARPSLFNQLDAILKETSESVNKVSIQVQRVFTEENAKNIQQTLSNLEHFSQIMASNGKSIDSALKSADIFLINMSKVSKEFPEIVNKLKIGANKFNVLATDVSSTMGAGKNAINQVSQHTIPQANQLLRRLNNISANLEQVSNDMRQNPSVIIRGVKPPKPGPGE